MTRDVFYTHDLETTPLQIKTDSAAGSENQFTVFFYTAEEEDSGVVYVRLDDPPQYDIGGCIQSSWTDFPVALPAEQTKIWTIVETATSVKVFCNEVDVVTYTFSDSSIDECVPTWSKETAKIKFATYDTASDQFRAAGIISSSRNTRCMNCSAKFLSYYDINNSGLESSRARSVDFLYNKQLNSGLFC